MTTILIKNYFTNLRSKLCSKENIVAVSTIGILIIIYLSLGIVGLVIKGPSCGLGTKIVIINNWIQIAGICYIVAIILFLICLYSLLLNQIFITMIISLVTQVGLLMLNIIGTITISTSINCAIISNVVWSAAIYQIVIYFISVIIYTIAFILICCSNNYDNH